MNRRKTYPVKSGTLTIFTLSDHRRFCLNNGTKLSYPRSFKPRALRSSHPDLTWAHNQQFSRFSKAHLMSHFLLVDGLLVVKASRLHESSIAFRHTPYSLNRLYCALNVRQVQNELRSQCSCRS